MNEFTAIVLQWLVANGRMTSVTKNNHNQPTFINEVYRSKVRGSIYSVIG